MPTRAGPVAHADVEACLQAAGPARGEVARAVRQAILDADPAVTETVMWNAPTFVVGVPFATLHLRGEDAVRVVLHRGARSGAAPGRAIADPEGLLDWRSPDRALLAIRDAADLHAKRAGLQAIVRDWIEAGRAG